MSNSQFILRLGALIALVAVLMSGSTIYQSSPLWAIAPEFEPDEEETPYEVLVRFRWELEGFSGGLLKFLPIVPTEGTGVLESRSIGEDRLDYRFRASFVNSPEEDFWIFRSILDLVETRTLYIQDLRRFRGKRKVVEADLTEVRAMDIISGLHWLRVIHPQSPQRIQAWADEKLYPVEVVVNGTQPYEREGRTIPVDHYTIQGIKLKGQRYWKPKADIWLRSDSDRLPVEILYQKGVAKVRLREIETPPRHSRSGD